MNDRGWMMLVFEPTPLSSEVFYNEFIGGFWGKLWISMPNMNIHFRFDRVKTFCTFIPTHPPSKSLYCTFNWVNHVVAKGGATWFVHHWHMWDH